MESGNTTKGKATSRSNSRLVRAAVTAAWLSVFLTVASVVVWAELRVASQDDPKVLGDTYCTSSAMCLV